MMMVGFAGWIFNMLPIADAIASVGDYKVIPMLNAPATPEAVLNAVANVAKGMIAQSHDAVPAAGE